MGVNQIRPAFVRIYVLVAWRVVSQTNIFEYVPSEIGHKKTPQAWRPVGRGEIRASMRWRNQ